MFACDKYSSLLLTIGRHDTQHNDTKPNNKERDAQHNSTQINEQERFAKCRYAECCAFTL